MSDSSAPDAPLDTAERLQLAPDARFRVVVEEGVLLRQDSAEVLIVNQVGARFLDLVSARRSLAEIIDQLESEFEVERERVSADIRIFAGELLALGALVRAPANDGE